MKYIDEQDIKAAFAEHLKHFRDYSPAELELVLSDFPNPYVDEYLFEEYLEDCDIEGTEYEMYASFANFASVGVFDIPAFRFYTFYHKDDVGDQTVGEYLNARKLYQVEEIDEDDFPPDDREEEDFLW